MGTEHQGIHCPSCGAELSFDSLYCWKCGASVFEDTPTRPPQQPPPQIIYQQAPAQREGYFLQSMNAGCKACSYGILAIVVFAIIGIVVGECGSGGYMAGKGGSSHLPDTATVDTSEFGELVAGHPGNVLVTRNMDGSAYEKYFNAAETDYKKLQRYIDEGACRLIRDGETVRIIGRSDQAAGWWRIRYEEEPWWIIGAFLIDDDGQQLNTKYGVN